MLDLGELSACCANPMNVSKILSKRLQTRRLSSHATHFLYLWSEKSSPFPLEISVLSNHAVSFPSQWVEI